jgi:hypothetical protein
MLRQALLTLVASLLFASGLPAQPARVNLSRTFPVLQVGNSLWVGTPAGLYQYSSSDDSYKRFPIPGKKLDPEIKQLFYYREWLWCVLDTGLAALHVRLNDWLLFDSSNGLPSNTITGIDFQDDFVWVSTPSGLARFDLLIEQWERYGTERGVPSLHVLDAKTLRADLWMLTADEVSSYSPQFERWRRFAVGSDSTGPLSRMFLLGDELWLIGSRGMVRFNTQLQQSQNFLLPFLSTERLLDLFLEDTRIWAISRDGLFLYEKQSGVWREFEGNPTLQGVPITTAAVAAEQVWIATPSNTLLWDRVKKTWEILDYSSGLTGAGFTSAYTDGVLTLLFRGQDLEYRKSTGSPWRIFFFGERGSSLSAANVLSSMFDNPEGGSLAIKDYKWNWQGTRITILTSGSRQFNDDGSRTAPQSSAAEQYDVKSQIEIPGGRRVTGFYNTIDFTETKYGLRLRGNDSDFVRELTWGDFRREQGTSPFTVPTEMFGTNLWLQYGAKTDRFKRSFLSARGFSGDARSRRTYQQFTGATTEFSRTVFDKDFTKNQYFVIPSLPDGITPEHLAILVDDGNYSTNTPQTLLGTTIAGLTGDYDPWIPVEDFYYYDRGRAVRFLRPVASSYRIVARYQIGGSSFEALLQDGSSTTSSAQNFYHLGAEKILPYTFSLSIRDSLGAEAPLSLFGLDVDGDGRVDDSWINYQNGVLRFPMGRPFPAEIYDQPNAGSRFSIVVSCQTEVPLLALRNQNLVRQSETVYLDGLQAVVGNDYVLDYTNGTLLFVREGLINPDTRIEVEYEYYDYASSRLQSASLAVSPSDRFFTQVEWQRLDRDSTDVINVFGELRQPFGSFDLKLIPGALYQTKEGRVTGRNVEALLSSSWLRVRSKVEDFDNAYRNSYHPQAIFGDVRRRWQVFTSVDVTDDLRLTGDLKDAAGFHDVGAPSDRSGSASLLFHRRDFPGTQLQVQSIRTGIGDTTLDKRFVQNLFEYQLPESWVSAASLKNLKLEQFFRYGRQSTSSLTGYSKDEFLQTYYRVTTILTDQFQAACFYRHNSATDLSVEGKRSLVSDSERLLADIAFGEWRFLQVNARMENVLQQYYHRSSGQEEYTLRQFSQANVRISPGSLWDGLSSLFFEVNHNISLAQSGQMEGSVGSWLWQLSAPERDASASRSFLRASYVKNDFRPSAQWLLQSLFEWSAQDLAAGSSALQSRFWRLNEKLDWKAGLSTRIIMQYKQTRQDFGYQRVSTDREPSVWVEQRWTSDIMTVAQLLYRRTVAEEYGREINTRELQSTLDLIWRMNNFVGMRFVEFRQTLFGSFRTIDGPYAQEGYQLTAGTSLDLYPIHSLIVRLRGDFGRMMDRLLPLASYTTLSYSARVSLQL